MRFLKFILAGRRGLDIDIQRNITLNVCQGLPDILQITATRDFDSLIGTTKTLPYSVPFTVWPAPSFRDTLTANNHVTAIASDNQVGQLISTLLSSHYRFLRVIHLMSPCTRFPICPWAKLPIDPLFGFSSPTCIITLIQTRYPPLI